MVLTKIITKKEEINPSIEEFDELLITGVNINDVKAALGGLNYQHGIRFSAEQGETESSFGNKINYVYCRREAA